MFLFYQNSYVEDITSNVMIFANVTFGRKLGLEQIKGVGSSRCDYCPYKMNRKVRYVLCSTCMQEGKGIRAHSERAFMYKRAHQNPPMRAP